jgi:L-glyceraldehyde reductase
MVALLKTGKTRAVGVSNFTVEQLRGIIDVTGVVPVVNQVEAHPLLQQDELVAFCKEKNILITAYSPLGNNLKGETRIVDYPEVKEVADEIGATPAQVLIAWGAKRGCSVIPKSVSRGAQASLVRRARANENSQYSERIESNFKQIELSDAAFAKVSQIGEGRRRRFNIPVHYNPPWEVNIFDEEVEKAFTTKKQRIV